MKTGRSSRALAGAVLEALLSAIVLAGCVHAPLNQPLLAPQQMGGVSYVPRQPSNASDDLVIWLFFSGGGTRAAALSYGVLKELARTPVPQSQSKCRMLDDVEVISAVSGGSFTAAYYCLYHDRIFQDYETRFLKRDIEGALLRRFLAPPTWPRLMSPYYGRSDMAAAYYDRHIFDRATFGDLMKSGGRPYLVINATDMTGGEQFAFVQWKFDLIGSDLSSFPISRAVAASSAFPLLLTPITLRNYSGSLSGIEANFLKNSTLPDAATLRGLEVRQFELSYLSKDRPYIHLVDGGLSDNLALQSLEDAISLEGGLAKTMARNQMAPVKKLVVIVVDAATHRGAEWSKRESIPGLTSALWQLSDDLGDRMNHQSVGVLREALQQWRQDGVEERRGAPASLGTGANPSAAGLASNRDYYLITVNFEKLGKSSERTFFQNLPTNFNLPPKTIDRVVAVAGQLLNQSSDYQRLLSDLGSRAKEPEKYQLVSNAARQ